jgi:hypothetical protein
MLNRMRYREGGDPCTECRKSKEPGVLGGLSGAVLEVSRDSEDPGCGDHLARQTVLHGHLVASRDQGSELLLHSVRYYLLKVGKIV